MGRVGGCGFCGRCCALCLCVIGRRFSWILPSVCCDLFLLSLLILATGTNYPTACSKSPSHSTACLTLKRLTTWTAFWPRLPSFLRSHRVSHQVTSCLLQRLWLIQVSPHCTLTAKHTPERTFGISHRHLHCQRSWIPVSPQATPPTLAFNRHRKSKCVFHQKSRPGGCVHVATPFRFCTVVPCAPSARRSQTGFRRSIPSAYAPCQIAADLFRPWFHRIPRAIPVSKCSPPNRPTRNRLRC